MKKGLVFIIIISALFWGIYYTRDIVEEEKPTEKIEKKIKDPTDKASSAVRETNLSILKTTLEMFRSREGRLPKDLNELIEKKYLSKIPDSGARKWNYNPQTGDIR